MLSLTFYGGVKEIGGNKVLLEDGDRRLFFDFGKSFATYGNFFEEFLSPRSGAGLLDLLETGLLPPLRGVYRQDLECEGLWSRFGACRELDVAAVLLSHAHVDHSGYISFLRQDIPVVSTALTAFIAKAMQDTNNDFEQQVCYFSPRVGKAGYLSTAGDFRLRHFLFADGVSLSPQAQDFWQASPAKRKGLESCALPAKGAGLDCLPIRQFAVDHSIFGACAYAIETSAGWVGYTGDLRLHGTRGALTERFIEEMGALKPYILICEGTRAGSTKCVSEDEVRDRALTVCREARGLVIADFGPRNVERLLTFHGIARETSRKLAVLGKDAYLLDAMGLVSSEVPALGKLPAVSLYRKMRGKYGYWEEQVHERHTARLVTASEVAAHPDDYILCFSFWDIGELVDIKPEHGVYIYSSSEAHGEEQKMDFKRLAQWLEHFGVEGIGLPREELNWEIPSQEQGLHSSGHASGPELLEVVRRIAPRVLIPIHTESPEYFRVLEAEGIKVVEPTSSGTLTFGGALA